MTSSPRRICHDLKTERPDVGQPLPGILRLLPLGIYASTLASICLATLLAWQTSRAREARDEARAEEALLRNQAAAIESQIASITAETKKAEEVKKWVAGSSSVQEVVVSILRSMRPTSTVSDLSLIRDKDDPRKLNFNLVISSGGPGQLDDIMSRLANEFGYRPYFASQKQERAGEITYSATLIKQERANDETRKQAAASSPGEVPVTRQ